MRSISSSVLLLAAVCLTVADTSTAQSRRRGRANRTAQVQQAPAIDQGAFTWQQLGPATMSGRITSIAVYPEDPSIWYVATASGGLLKTVNNGTTFEHQFDDQTTVSIGAVAVSHTDPNVVWVGTGEANPRNSVSYGNGIYKSVDGGKTWKHVGLKDSFQTGDIVIHPDNHDVVYVGALGRLYGANEERGLYKTTDGGENWERILYVDDKTGIIDLAMQPGSPDTMLVATYERQRDGFDTNDPAKKIAPGSGLYRTTDGGANFQKVTEGLPSCELGRISFDFYQADPSIVYALVESAKIGMAGDDVGYMGLNTRNAETGARIRRVTKDGPAAEAGLKQDDIILSVNGELVLDNDTFQVAMAQHAPGETVVLQVARKGEAQTVELTLGSRPEPEEGEEPSRPYGTRLGGQSPNIQELQGKNGHEHGGLYRSEDAGASWTRVNSINPRPMYFSCVRVDPSDDQRIYVTGVSGAQSEDGGKTFTVNATRGVHSDQHALWVDPADGRHMIIGSDGGLYVTHDRTATWRHLNHMALGQFYHVAIGPRGPGEYWVYGGLQDNGTWGAPRRSPRGGGPVNTDWVRIGGGDGFLVDIDPTDPNQIYYSSQNGAVGRTHLVTMEGGSVRPRAPRGTRYRWNWRTPFTLSHHNPRIYYVAGNHVFRSLDRGSDPKRISPEITRTDRGSATAFAESPRDEYVLYVGSDDGALWRTKDGGANWEDLMAAIEAEAEADAGGISPSEQQQEGEANRRGGPREATAGDAQPLSELIPGPMWVAGLEASRYETGRVYLALDGHRSNSDAPWVFVSEDFGSTWKNISANLPRGSTRCIREDVKNRNLLYCGTEFGFYVSVDRGQSWSRLHNNLPTVAIHEVAQHAGSGEIAVGTHGRSIWVMDVSPLRGMTEEAISANAWLFEPPVAYNWQRKHSRGSSGGASRYQGENPDSGAVIHYRLGRDAGQIALEIQAPDGRVVRTLDAPRKAGLHRVEWNLRGNPEPMSAEREAELRARFGDERFEANRSRFQRARNVSPGEFKVVLTVNGKAMTQTLKVERDPAAPQGTRFVEDEILEMFEEGEEEEGEGGDGEGQR